MSNTLTNKEVMALNADGASALHKAGVAGDDVALRDWLRYALWRKVNTAKQFSERKRANMFKALDGLLNINIEREGAKNG